jgi:molecular chaperone GrpE
LIDLALKNKTNSENTQKRKSLKRPRYSRELKKLKDDLKIEQEKSNNYLIRLKYLQADFDNYRKRVDREISEATRESNVKLIVSLLEVIDDLERAIETASISQNMKNHIEGIKMVHKNFITILEREGLSKIEAVGKPFDPNMHEILTKIPSNKYDENTVIEEIRKGFKFKEKIIRPSIVKISCKIDRSREE